MRSLDLSRFLCHTSVSLCGPMQLPFPLQRSTSLGLPGGELERRAQVLPDKKKPLEDAAPACCVPPWPSGTSTALPRFASLLLPNFPSTCLALFIPLSIFSPLSQIFPSVFKSTPPSLPLHPSLAIFLLIISLTCFSFLLVLFAFIEIFLNCS